MVEIFGFFSIIIIIFLGGVGVGMYLQRATDVWCNKRKTDRI